MAPDVERSGKNSSKSKLLTMDVIELTLLLKSIGFRLESIDYDELRCWSGKKFGENGNAASTATPASTSATNSIRTDAADHHYINVEISCSKSKIVSNLSLKFNDDEPAVVTDAAQHPMTDPSKMIVCSCPKREMRNINNSFWEVQSSGTFSNQRRSINSLMNPESGIDHDTSSNLLPVLSTKSIALTHVLTQVLLNQYKNNMQFGELSMAKDVDIKSIMRTIESTNIASILANGKVDNGGDGQIHDLNLITPMSSMNVTPTEPEALMNSTIPKVNDQTTALNDTVNTEAFTSPKSDMFTSSPHGSETTAITNGRDSKIINCLNKARQSIDHAILSIKLNATRSLAQDVASGGVTTRPLSVTMQELPDNSTDKRRSVGPQLPRMLNGRNASQATVNARPPRSTMNRRASLGSIGIGRMATKSGVASPAVTSRMNTSRPSSSERPASATSKLAAVRKAVSGIGKAVSSTNTAIGNRATGSTAAKTPTTQAASSIKRPTSISRRVSSPAMISTGTPTTAGLATRKTVATSKINSLLPSKLAKK
ncbi:probable serine/threonine-protein kinase nek3 [Sitodiplosis mosellana]|uniref:probable serine/threonine-protein kinase nek3 n=1 Tax=Sitodiplosis mosellana TaxID=263140 RepID=UPI002443D4AE|nr:probable serine/threonine-protein kinase nek3 [Sitodiplosis mosellana]